MGGGIFFWGGWGLIFIFLFEKKNLSPSLPIQHLKFRVKFEQNTAPFFEAFHERVCELNQTYRQRFPFFYTWKRLRDAGNFECTVVYKEFKQGEEEDEKEDEKAPSAALVTAPPSAEVASEASKASESPEAEAPEEASEAVESASDDTRSSTGVSGQSRRASWDVTQTILQEKRVNASATVVCAQLTFPLHSDEQV